MMKLQTMVHLPPIISSAIKNFGVSDSIQSQHKEIPHGLKVWTIDERFGDRKAAQPDTISDMFMNTFFTTGLRGEFNSLGNLARHVRIVFYR